MANAICVVAGAGPGIGLTVAQRFAAHGYDLALMARDEVRLARAAAQLGLQHGVEILPVALDLADPDAIERAFDKVRERLGDAEVLVYNAAGWHEGPAMTLPPDAFARDLALSVGGALACAQQVFGAMQERGEGSLLFTGGGLALRPQFGRGLASLTAGKSALRGLVHAIAAEVAEAGVHAATVTIAGNVAAGGAFDPRRIAEAFWQLHAQARPDWTVEVVFDGSNAAPGTSP